MLNRYNRQIADKILEKELLMIKNTPQPEMFYNELNSLKNLHEPENFKGGARPSPYVQCGNTVATHEPTTLTVGHFEQVPFHLASSGENIKRRGRGRPKKHEEGGSFWDTLGSVVKTAAPIAVPLMMSGLGLPEEHKKKRGRPKKSASNGGNFFDTIKSIGRSVAPIAADIGKEVILPVAKDVGKDALKSYLTKGSKGAGMKKTTKKETKGCGIIEDITGIQGLGLKQKRTRKSKMEAGNFFDTLKDIGRNIAPIAKDIAVPVAKEMLTNYVKGKGLPNKRGQLIKKVMAEKGLNLPQASKYIKEHKLM